jgi:hypothetical protein
LPILTRQRLMPGRAAGAVVVDVGGAISELSRLGSSFARFMRCLRMGKTPPADDERCRQALSLFPARTFRDATMPELMDITRKLRDIFQDEVQLLDMLDFHELTDADADDLAADGVNADDVERQARPRRRFQGRPPRGQRGRPGGRGVNEGDDVDFEDITTIERLTPDRQAHQVVAVEVRRPATILRRALLHFGTSMLIEKRRLSGRRLDRSGLVSAVLRGDPRLLASRRTLPAADVFVGVLIDCSGSMAGENLERAKRFGVLLAEATAGLADVDARFFGFTDEVIYDAGNARRCAVTSLEADGGNNDAAALAYVAGLARRSGRKATLLVMISDGAPTECSVDALRALVQRLQARGQLCAQVAVEAIDDEDICFDRHILLDEYDGDDDGAARRFGVVIEELLRVARAQGRA